MTKEDRAHNLLIYMVMINSRKYPQAYGPVSKGEGLTTALAFTLSFVYGPGTWYTTCSGHGIHF
jgi:hypothetical protein